MLHFVAALKAHAKLRCTVNTVDKGGNRQIDEEKYAKMTYWVCAYAPNPLCAARRKAT